MIYQFDTSLATNTCLDMERDERPRSWWFTKS
jgi:hypothetical protein